jgi:hypothetical protein
MSKLKVNAIETHNDGKVTIDSPVEIADGSNVTTLGSTTTVNLANVATITLPSASINGTAITGGPLASFSSAGITDNATTTKLTLSNTVLTVEDGTDLTLTGSSRVTSPNITVGTAATLPAATTVGGAAVGALVPRMWWRGTLTITYSAGGIPVCSSLSDITNSNYGLTSSALNTTSSPDDGVLFTYNDTTTHNGTKSAAIINFYNDNSMPSAPPYTLTYSDATLKITFTDGSTPGFDSATLSVHMTIMVMSNE